jgi:hypothetical protein
MSFGRVLRWLLLAALLATTVRAERTGLRRLATGEPWAGFPQVKFQRGDDRAWARADWDDRGWQRRGAGEMPSHDGIYWVRFHVVRGQSAAELERNAVVIAVVASYQVYWDGRLLGRSGVVGASRADEVPGPLDNVFRIPDELAGPGDHVVALRLSSFRTGFRTPVYTLNFLVHSVRDYLEFRTRESVFAVVAAGGALAAGVGLGFFWLLVDRRLSLLLFGGACLCAAAMQAALVWRGLFDYPYDWHYPRVVLIAVSLGALGMFWVAFVAVFLRVPRPWLAVLAVGALMLAVWPDERVMVLTCTIAVAASAGLAIFGIVRRRAGARPMLAGLLVSGATLAWAPGDFVDRPFLLNFGAPLLGGVAALTLRWRDERRAARQAQLTAARLEVELLKKNIQPHFLLNTLTTLSEVIEQEPHTAVNLIEALADEFRLLARVSGERLIPLADELALCRGHLRVMSLRQEVSYGLRVEGATDAALVPPALFLTLVENAITHGRARGGAVEFVLRVETGGGTERHEFRAPLPAGGAPRPVRPGAEGTGSRYVKARLEESFAGRWKFSAGPRGGEWVTVIEWTRSGAAGGAA